MADHSNMSSVYTGSIKLMEPFFTINGTVKIDVVIENQSDQMWISNAQNPVNISYHWLDEEWKMVVFDGVRTPLPEGGIAPGASALVAVNISPPTKSGNYHLFITLVREGDSWFDTNNPQFKPAISKVVIKIEDRFQNQNENIKRIAILGTPRSGNTWLHRMLSYAYGLEVLTVHRPTDVDWSNLSSRLVLQLHWHPKNDFLELLRQYDMRPVVLCRHPLDVLISILHFARHEVQTNEWLDGEAGGEESIIDATPCDNTFLEYAVSHRASILLGLSSEWMECADVVSLRYESLVKDSVSELQKIVNRDDFPNPEEVLTQAVAAHTLQKNKETACNSHFWQGKPGLWRELILPAQARAIADVHRKIFKKMGYICDPDETLTRERSLAAWRSYEVKNFKKLK